MIVSSLLLTTGILLYAFAGCQASSAQIPLTESQKPDTEDAISPLNFSSSAPLIFHSTFALLQQWPQSFFPNGHIIAPCTIPKNTNLYHAHPNASFPPSPEWFALDSAMAYSILGMGDDAHMLTFRTTKDVKCILFDGTSAALMDDGSMDSQMLLIHNNSENVLGNIRFGRPPGKRPPGKRPPYGDQPPRGPGGNWSNFNPLQPEYDRATGLCDFIREKDLGGLGWGYEGIVRMNAAFEVIWCNFSSPSARLVSWLNVSSPTYEGLDRSWSALDSKFDTTDEPEPPPRPPRPGGPRGGRQSQHQPFLPRTAYAWFYAAAKAYGFVGGVPGRGEARVKIDSCGLFTFYDPSLEHQTQVRIQRERGLLNLTEDGYWSAPSDQETRHLGLQKLTRRRRYQRATNVSVSDGLRMRHNVETSLRDTLKNHDRTCSGLDWVAISQQTVADYSSELYDLRNLLSNNTDLSNATDVRHWLIYLRGAAHQLAMPFYEYPLYDNTSLNQAFSISTVESQEALERCKAQHAPFAAGNELSRSEQLTHQSVSEVISAICNTTIALFLALEPIWLANFNNISSPPSTIPQDLQTHIRRTKTYHLQRIEELMAWLGWAEQWTSCNPGCAVGQVCAIPIWPVMGVGHFSGGKFGYESPEEAEQSLFHGRCVDAQHVGGEEVW
ncbi:Hypothetical predicted protein [Lecanosticta acicola]|uniref:Uncharacterized protein n=1 Tax=Lecanosticta acicola TaxID=111012 RepID=A0AAI8Z4M4_9PEZI|nr:Hypothetical predicted protein [Lecanosticta acicola]